MPSGGARAAFFAAAVRRPRAPLARGARAPGRRVGARAAGYLTVIWPCIPAWRWPGTVQKKS